MRPFLPAYAALLATGVMFAGCSDDEIPTFVAVTYNGGIAPGFVPGATERLPLTAAQVGAIEADVVCVQEFWLPDAVAALKAATEGAFPHQIYVDPDPGMPTSGAACDPTESEELVDCAVAAGCDQVCPDDLATCALGSCSMEFNAVSEECQSCIGGNIGLPFDQIISNCQAEAVEYSYEGQFGIAILSKHPITASDTTVLTSHFNRRGIIHAQLDTPAGEVHAYCTHLSAVFSDNDGDGLPDIPFPEATGSWEEEQADQITALIALTESQAAGKQILLMGDFNTGPAGPGYEAEVPENYQLLVDAGFANPYLETDGHQCTYCADNPIIAGDTADDESSAAIDFVLLKGFPGAATGTRIIDDEIEITSCDETEASAYSDHYGVSVAIEY